MIGFGVMEEGLARDTSGICAFTTEVFSFNEEYRFPNFRESNGSG
jgi:hypothetical protein